MVQPYERDGFTGCEMVGLHEAFKKGDLDLVRSLLHNPADFPNCQWPGGGSILEYAIYHAPLAFIRSLIGLGITVNYEDAAGFPCLIATLSTEREDRLDVLKLLLEQSADVQQRGVNNYTPLHYAVARNDAPAVELLLTFGADPDRENQHQRLRNALARSGSRGSWRFRSGSSSAQVCEELERA
jgi:ankyrin repeat protein